jgi:hypothetical protein
MEGLSGEDKDLKAAKAEGRSKAKNQSEALPPFFLGSL